MFDKIRKLAESTERSYSAHSDVKEAFALGLLWGKLPTYEGLDTSYSYEVRQILFANGDSELNRDWEVFSDLEEPMIFKIGFIADTATSWHDFYRMWRQHFERVFVKRNGGLIAYLLKNHDPTRPEGFETIWLLLQISLSTCKRVSKGKRMVEEEIFETVCEDMVDLEEGYDNTPDVPSVEFASGKSPDLSHEFDDDIPF